MRIIILIGRLVLNVIYFFHKLFPIRNKVAIISRQSNEPTLDIRLISEELEQRKDIEVKVLCKTLESGMLSKIRYLFHMIGPQMHAFATSKVVVLDSYCIAASLLHHRSKLKIIQMWHAMGGFKKFGYSIIDKEEGSKGWIARTMRMHNNYDYILASSKESAIFFSEAFGYDLDHFKILPLPRTDLLRSAEFMTDTRRKIIETIPQLEERETILYAPTFRKDEAGIDGIDDLIREVDLERYNLIVALHPLMSGVQMPEQVITTQQFTTLELLSVCEYFITDYSAMIYEAALAAKPIFLYAYDFDQYTGKRGFYIDYCNDLPERPYFDPKEIMEAVKLHEYDVKRSISFGERYVAKTEEPCTVELADFINTLVKKHKPIVGTKGEKEI
ncbi:CDP-glycerol glycerophosphotransferase family protein [Ihubacter massiliensis]|uniref:CDP-glycerol glycerophosphotransferase family protein n=1 Tax=Hominibacterium faecale TaxID=2839743 RepID=A0A9J6QUS6_9FIRM|nr:MULTISPECIES: CDP-glycerol glycerophosphotransferase family protein [Eubacteriales Family XIII. Incertae Sedis]MCC2864716.1 CDP-glycerol glycerophosphotransferase family protein [Anaerovorax odorimutans]MCO7123770.1 CDP-glycerol glycerophosphotransferase family protein [Ihubacter massiliensis]MCU7378695.1 CDP-glycerol glycerophosphotransferase family protein [Hominibacterium faecale]